MSHLISFLLPESKEQWFFNNIESFEPKVGFETRFVVQVEDRNYPHLWKLTEVVPMKKICYEWRFEGYPGSAISEFEIYEVGNRARLRLTYTVVEDFPDNIPEFERKSGVEGWNYFIKDT
ncbi:SRPBCC domain-containing protein, partial [Chloroflexi bacterium TSY]|nr:SRPBCC domain-containing protein [Chloroflexi bacterium TSY]